MPMPGRPEVLGLQQRAPGVVDREAVNRNLDASSDFSVPPIAKCRARRWRSLLDPVDAIRKPVHALNGATQHEKLSYSG
jgi:hypothetical protein